MLTSLFSLFYVIGEFHRFLHRGRDGTCVNHGQDRTGICIDNNGKQPYLNVVKHP